MPVVHSLIITYLSSVTNNYAVNNGLVFIFFSLMRVSLTVLSVDLIFLLKIVALYNILLCNLLLRVVEMYILFLQNEWWGRVGDA